MDTAPCRIGLLYPTRDCGEDDFVRFAALVDPAIEVAFGYVPWGESVSDVADLDPAGKLAAVRELGEPRRLQQAVDELAGFAPEVLSWACSSCSFLCGYEGAIHQAADLAERAALPASSTSLAFVAATQALGAQRVSVASVYGEEGTAGFVEFLRAAGISTVHHVAFDAPSDRALARWDRDRIVELVAAGDSDDADAVLVPETALHTAGLLAELEARTGKPVLTATQVTIWRALRQLGRDDRRPGLGTLFAR
ncbi:decarboxylase [Pseudonocardia sp. C8]|uniref:maleate cis-trans isomerase family protein n=1 Tax=Pseudonocardia sp. C8 TaxID=2762759 RepID=UPI0016431B93|nr:decarboxylase [Pseudonocardia sp. C8]MBC3190094.1 decarboxylase [Pseudonocardia sp. C8]